MGDGLVRLYARIVSPALCVPSFEKSEAGGPVYVTWCPRLASVPEAPDRSVS